MAKSKGRGFTRGGSSSGTGTGAGIGGAATTIAAPEPAAPKKKTNPVQFMKEVRAEARKITWTSRRETWITSVMVFIMVLLAAIFFFVTDLGLGWGVAQILRFANAG